MPFRLAPPLHCTDEHLLGGSEAVIIAGVFPYTTPHLSFTSKNHAKTGMQRGNILCLS
jgi:hypothetical protein